MVRQNAAVRRFAMVLAAGLAVAAPLAAQKNQPAGPAAKSAGPVKELVGLLEAKKLTSFLVKDPAADSRFIAVLHIPGTQLLVVAANYEGSTDMEYFLYSKEFMRAYQDLNASVHSKDKVFVEDLVEDGLKAVPAKDEAADSITIGGSRRAFDGDFADPKRRNQANKISQDDYLKAYSEADETYTKLLGALIEGLKKVGA